jgi:pyridoxal phosphate enzyme (YggS family)
MTAISDRFAAVRDRVAEAARRSGRLESDITVVAISKTFPIEAVVEAFEAGVRHFGENKAQEFAEKVEALRDVGQLQWHFVGHLQRNKAKLVVGRATLFHALDSYRLAEAIQSAAERAGIDSVDCLMQVNVSGEETKFGVDPEQLAELADSIVALDRVRIRGLMTLAEPTQDETVLKGQFGLLRRLHESLPDHGFRDAEILSMGMSGDYELAIEEGATHVRIGSAIFGPRACAIPA